MSRAFAIAGAAALAAALMAGCRGFDRLERDDPEVTEDEVYAAGQETGRADLAPHLRHVLANAERYPTEVVVAAIVATAAREDRESAPLVARLAESPDREVRWHATRARATLQARPRREEE